MSNNTEYKYIKDGILNICHISGDIQSFNIKGMQQPVVCNHCGQTYDLTNVKVNHRFNDCDQFTTPCCNYKFADTREWKSFKDFQRVDLKEVVTIN